VKFASGIFLVLLFLGALFWAREQDPFSRQWFTLKTAQHGSFKCVAVLPKPKRQYPIIIYVHGSDGSLMNDGKDLRQMAELGLAVVSLEYNQTNEVAFTAQFESLLNYLGRQKWAGTNAIAWVGMSLGANRIMDFALRRSRGDEAQTSEKLETPHLVSYRSEGFSEQPPQLLVLISGAGLPEAALATTNTHLIRPAATFSPSDAEKENLSNLHCPVLLIHGEQDEIFPVADTKRLAAVLQTNGVRVELRIIPGLPHGLEPERGVVFRCIGEYCREHLANSKSEIGNRKSEIALQSYHSIARWQTEAPPLWWFLIPAAVVAAGVLACRKARASRPREMPVEQPRNKATKAFPLNLVSLLPGCLNPFGRRFRAAGRTPSMSGGTPDATPLNRAEIALRWLAVLLATWALVETAIHLVTPYFSVNATTLSISRRFLVQPKERADFECLAAQTIWQNEKLKTLLEHVELAGYNRELINWQLDDKVYRDFVLSPVIESSTFSLHLSTSLNWRRLLWEEFYPRIRHESSPEEAARIVVRHLRERITVVSGHLADAAVREIWLRQLTDAAGFEKIYIAALRSVGIAARLNADMKAELFADGKWQLAPRPIVPTFLSTDQQRR
jgi:acetyl esterase/lipase